MRMFLVAVVLSAASAYPCTYSYGGVNYDASPLASSTDYTFKDQNVDFWLNMCQPVINPLCGTNSAACQQFDPNSENGKASLGAANTATFNPPKIPGENGQGFTVQFVNGDIPPGQTQARSMEIDFVCDSGAGVGSPSYQGEQPELHYNFQWRSQYACAAPKCTGLTCTDCTANVTNGCVWCIESASCMQGPVDTKDCYNWIQVSKFCPALACPQAADCHDCTAIGGCGWCLDSDSCIGIPDNSTICKDLITEQPFCPNNAHSPAKVKVVVN